MGRTIWKGNQWAVEAYLDELAERNAVRDTREPEPFHVFRLRSKSEVKWDNPMSAASAMQQFMAEVTEFHQGPRAV